MAQTKILIDTNSYLRLAQSIHPLLLTTFGKNEYCLYVLKELNGELTNHRLASKFHWVNDEEYVSNRQIFPSLSRKQQRAIKDNLDFIWGHIQSDCPGPSKVDALYIAYGLELDIPIVTDDQDMTATAEAFEVRILTTLELLKLMVDCSHVSIEKVKAIISYWKHIGDTPCSPRQLDANFQSLFDEKLP